MSKISPINVVVDEERYYSEQKVVTALAHIYNSGGSTQIARACDQILDPSGRLLGVVRDKAAKTETHAHL